MTTPVFYAEGLRTLWFLASRGVSATWDGTAVALAPPDLAVDVQALEAVLRPDADGRSYLQRARERHAPFLEEVKAAKPEDMTHHQWRRAIEGLESFLLSGHGGEAERLGWQRDELYRVPELWSQIWLCGAVLLIGDAAVTSVTATEIRIRTIGGADQTFRRKPQPDLRLVYSERLKLTRCDSAAGNEEAELRAREFVINFHRERTGADIEAAKQAVTESVKATS